MLKMKIKICMDLCFLSDGVLSTPAQKHKGTERKILREITIFMDCHGRKMLLYI